LTQCHCGASLVNDPWHVLSHKGGPEAMRRHDEIVNKLRDAIQRAGGQAFIEPRQDILEDRRRIDIFAVLGAKSYHIDVCVTHPTASTYLAVSCQGKLRSTKIAAARKRNRFAVLAAAEGAEFVPFILETYGGFGIEARKFIAEVARYTTISSSIPYSETCFMIRSEIHKSLFEGNLRLANAEFQLSNPIRYASGRYGAVPPRPPIQTPDYDSDEEMPLESAAQDSTTNPTTTPTTITTPTTPTTTTSTSTTSTSTTPTSTTTPTTTPTTSTSTISYHSYHHTYHPHHNQHDHYHH